jgi:hypothetical protein
MTSGSSQIKITFVSPDYSPEKVKTRYVRFSPRIKELHSIVARDVELMPIEEKRGDGITLYRALDDKFEVLGAISLDRVRGNNPHHIFSVYMARVVIAVLLHHLGELDDGCVGIFVILI